MTIRTAIDIRRSRVEDLIAGDTISVPADLMYSAYDYKSSDNIATRLLKDPQQHSSYPEYYILHTSYGDFYVQAKDWIGVLRPRQIYKETAK